MHISNSRVCLFYSPSYRHLGQLEEKKHRNNKTEHPNTRFKRPIGFGRITLESQLKKEYLKPQTAVSFQAAKGGQEVKAVCIFAWWGWGWGRSPDSRFGKMALTFTEDLAAGRNARPTGQQLEELLNTSV